MLKRWGTRAWRGATYRCVNTAGRFLRLNITSSFHVPAVSYGALMSGYGSRILTFVQKLGHQSRKASKMTPHTHS